MRWIDSTIDRRERSTMAAVAAMNWSKNGSAMVFVDRQNREKTLGTYLVNSVSRKRGFSTDLLTGKLLTCAILTLLCAEEARPGSGWQPQEMTGVRLHASLRFH